jgi:hypothetical protein
MMNFFCSVEHANQWRRERIAQGEALLSGQPFDLIEAVDLGRDLWGKLRS